MSRPLIAAILAGLITAACGGPEPSATSAASITTVPAVSTTTASTTTASTESTESTGARALDPLWRITIEGALSMNVVSRPGHQPVVGWITSDAVPISTIDPVDGTLSNPVDLNGEVVPIGHPIERPALAIGADGSVDVAFTSFLKSGGAVFYTTWNNGSFAEPVAISGPPMPETNLVHMALDRSGLPVLSWLEDSTLSVATTETGTPVELELVDDLTCDCCNPVPAFVGDDLIVAYRDLVRTDGAPYRDVAVVTSSDGAFGQPVTVADDHWAIAACPFTGPSVVAINGELVVAWMDARQSAHPDQDATTIWVDRSADAGRTFGADLAVTNGSGIHRWPVMALDDSASIHLVWQTHGQEGGLSYAHSSDGGRAFSPPRLIEDGRVQAPSIAHHGAIVLVTWTVGSTGHVAAWSIGDLAGE